jgi:hypothetical protein
MGLVMRRVLKPLWVLLALLFLVEAWLWEHLRAVVARLVDVIAWQRLKARFAAFIEHLSPYPTLLIFLIPPVILFPFKLLGVWMLAHGSWLGAMTVLVLAKLVGTAVAAFIFDATRPKLLQLPWFRWLYELLLGWLAKAHAIIDPIKARVRERIRAILVPVKRRLRRWLWLAKPGRPGRFFRRLARLRRRAYAQPAE